MNFYRRYPQGYLLFFHITGKSVEISCYIKSPTGRDRTAAEGNHVASNRARRGNVPGHILLKLNSLKGGTYSACVRRAEGERPGLCRQRWEAVFRRERIPESIDRISCRKRKLFVTVQEYQRNRTVANFQRRRRKMNKTNTKKLAIAAVFCAVAVVGSLFSVPVFGSKCSPVQHMVNVLCAVLLGPGYGVGVAFCASLIRNLLALGSILAFPGSMFGALLCGVVYWKSKNLLLTLLGEVFGTAILGGLCAYPLAVLVMGVSAGEVAFYAYVLPFFVSTAGGAILAGILIQMLKKAGVLRMAAKK